MSYEVMNDTVYRNGEEVAVFVDGELQIPEKFHKYSRYIKEAYEKVNKPITDKVKKNVKVVEVEFNEKVRRALSAICGKNIPMPNREIGYKKSNYRNLILKNRINIMKSDLLTREEAIMIINITK